MESKKSKIFTRKLIALFLAALMVISTFTGVMTVFAKSTDDYHDSKLAANFLAWAETTDSQTAEALLDYADLYLPQIMESLDLGDIKPRGSTRINFSYSVSVININIKGYADSVDGLLDLIYTLQHDVLEMKVAGISALGIVGGDVENVSLKAIDDLTRSSDGVVSKCGVAYRSANDAKKIIITLGKLLYNLSHDFGDGKNVLNQFINGKFDLGIIGNFVDLWGLLKDPLNMWDNYQTNLVYNIVANLIFENTDWYSESQVTAFKEGANGFINKGKDQTVWDFDNELFGKLTSELIQGINIQVTYANKVQQIDLDPNSDTYGDYLVDENNNNEPIYVKDSSKRRWFLIDKYIQQGKSYADAVAAVNANEGSKEGFYCDPNLRYSMNEDGTSDGNVLLFTYGDQVMNVKKTDTLTDIAFDALEIAWQTVLKPTLETLKIDYDANRDNSTIFNQEAKDFDNEFYAWMVKEKRWNSEDWTANYSDENVQAWAADVYKNYSYKQDVEESAESFLEGVRQTFVFDRTRAADAKNNWRDVDATKLYGELRYSMLADKYFNMQTGPINLYFVQTGDENIENFFKTAFTEYGSIVEGINNALVAAVKDFLPDSDNIGIQTEDGITNLELPELAEIKTTNSHTIATTLVGSAAKVFEYVANATDANILGAFYENNGITNITALNNISEANIEEAALPMLISLLNQLSITDVIHNDEWDYCADAEGVAVTVLAEYLSYVLPDKDYSELYGVENGKLVPKYDVDGKNGVTWLEDVIMPMARDALGYVIQSVVPCRKTDGNEWSVYTSNPKTDKTTIFDILNSVLCYYGSTDSFKNDHGNGAEYITGKGVAALLGCVDSDGKCTISFSKTIWENIDTMLNTLLPVVGSLQIGAFGGANSYDLIYTKIIKGVLDISANGGAITNIIEQVVDIINSNPISHTGADIAAYDYIVAPTINGIFGAKYAGEGYTNVIPQNAAYYDTDSSSNTKSESPFNALIHVDTLAGYASDTGVLGVLICNIVEAFGVNDYWSKSGDRWQGAMFAVKAVNNFIPSFVPQLSDMQFGPVTAKMDISSYSGMSGNQSLNTTHNYLTITNTSLGLNRFYRESPTGDVQREQRYFANIKNIEMTELTEGNGSVGLQSTEYGVLQPGGSIKIPINGATPRRAKTYIFRAAVTYNMFEAELNGTSLPSAPTSDGDYLFGSDITTYAYLTITVGGDWQSVIYPDNRATKDGDSVVKYVYATTFVNNTAERTTGTAPNQVQNSAAGGQDGNLIAAVPTNMVIPSQDPSVANLYSIRVRNNGSANRDYSGIVAYIADGTEYYAVNGTTVADSLSTMSGNSASNMAYALIDSDGNLLNTEMYDYRIKDSSGNWGAWYKGYTRSALDTMENENGSIHTEFSENRVEERTHITYTFDEACAAGIVTGVQRSANGDGYTYQNVFVNPSATLVASENANAISWTTPIDGYDISNHGAQIAGTKDTFDLFLKYNGSGVTPSKDATVLNLCFVTPSGSYMTSTTNVYVADQSDLYSLTSAYDEESSKMASYRPSDFVDFDEETGTSADYNAIVNAMTSALDLAATPLSVDNAAKVSSTKITQAKTSETTSTTGDKAYRPATAAEIPADVLKNAYKSGDVYYINKECTAPIYSNVELTDADVTNGKDAAGQAVTKVGGTYYLANAVSYTSEWDTTTYWTEPDLNGNRTGAPYYKVIEDEDHINKWGDSTVYNQVQFVYRDIYGNKVNSDDRYDGGAYKWVVKFADTETAIKPNEGTTDYRGAYQQGIDTINYYNSIFSKILKTVGAQSVAENVTAVRSVDSNSVNYDVAIYEKMVMVAREAEKLIWYEDAVDESGKKYQKPVTDKSSMEIEIAVNRFQDYYERAQATSRDYIGNRLEAEIAAHHSKGENGSYNDFVVEKTGAQVRFEYSTKPWDEEDNVDVYTVKVKDGTEVGFGTVDTEGNLVNENAEGNKIYTDASWNAYVNALGAAVDTAQGQSAKVSEVYTAKSHLVMAENNLTVYTGEEGEDTNKFTVTGKITVSTNTTGTEGIEGVGGIKLYMGEQVVGESDENGFFEIKLPKGEPVGLTIKGDTTIDRNITINGDANVSNIYIPMVICNYEATDGAIDLADASAFLEYLNDGNNYVYANLEATDSVVDLADASAFLGFLNEPIKYAEWSQTTYVFE